MAWCQDLVPISPAFPTYTRKYHWFMGATTLPHLLSHLFHHSACLGCHSTRPGELISSIEVGSEDKWMQMKFYSGILSNWPLICFMVFYLILFTASCFILTTQADRVISWACISTLSRTMVSCGDKIYSQSLRITKEVRNSVPVDKHNFENVYNHLGS